MGKRERYAAELQSMQEWESFLLSESGLPGPRANLELVQAVADEGSEELFLRYLGHTADIAPINTPDEFLPVCGIVGLGRLLAEGRTDLLPMIRASASDSRWRMREGVCMALQRWGDVDMDALISEMESWAAGNPLEQRAAAAALCEPRLLKEEAHAHAVLSILDHITKSLVQSTERKSASFLALRKGLAYCWSVAVAAAPGAGKPLMERWLVSDDRDVRWIMKQNLQKKRLIRIEPAWVERCVAQLSR